MQKILLSIMLALFMALALVGVKRAFSPSAQAKSGTLVAIGGPPQPPIPW